MNKIILLFFTFSGNCTGFAQNQAKISDSITVKRSANENSLRVKNDSLFVKERPLIRLFPNPAKNKVEMEIKGFEPGYIQVQLLDNNGKLMRDERRFVFSGNEIIILMFSQNPGLYFLLVRQGDKKLKSKLVIR